MTIDGNQVKFPVLKTQWDAWWNDQHTWKSIASFSRDVKIPETSLRDYKDGRVFPQGKNREILFRIIKLECLAPATSQLIIGGDFNPSNTTLKLVTEKSDNKNKPNINHKKPDLEPYKTFRIAVSGDVIVTKLECSIIDTREFQRLRAIKQLGTSYLVYPSAIHTRFEHSLGALFEASRIMDAIRNNPKSSDPQKTISDSDIVLVRLAALLHDLTHIPFGHTLEDETIVIEQDHDEDEHRRKILLVESSIGKILTESLNPDDYALLISVLVSEHKTAWKLGSKAFIADIVKNTLCADLLDYLRRDVYFCNLQDDFGDRFLKYLYLDEVKIKKEESEEEAKRGATSRRLIVRLMKDDKTRHRRDVLSELVDLLRARYSLGERVYFHHAKVSSSAMVARAVWAAMHPEKGKALTLEQMSRMGDDELLLYLEETCEDRIAQKLAASLVGRNLYKNIFTLTRIEAKASNEVDWISKLTTEYHRDPINRTRVEDQLASLCGLQPGDVLIYCPNPNMAKKYARMLVNWRMEPKALEEIDDPVSKPSLTTIADSHELLWNLSVFVEPSARDNKEVTNILRDLCFSLFSPPNQPADNERRFESAIRAIVNHRLGDKGNPRQAEHIVESLVARHRDSNSLIFMDDIDNTIKKILK
jgi:uncharacterized protein